MRKFSPATLLINPPPSPTIRRNAAANILNGGRGDNILKGGAGADAFFDMTLGSGNVDRIVGFVSSYNFARRLETLGGLTPCEAICKTWSAELSRFRSNPLHQMPGPNI